MSNINSIIHAEQHLIQSIQATTTELNRIGQSNLQGALQELQQASQAAKQRMTEAMAQMTAMLADVSAHINELASEVFEELSTSDVIASHQMTQNCTEEQQVSIESSVNQDAPESTTDVANKEQPYSTPYPMVNELLSIAREVEQESSTCEVHETVTIAANSPVDQPADIATPVSVPSNAKSRSRRKR